jgi:hypothetical protein
MSAGAAPRRAELEELKRIAAQRVLARAAQGERVDALTLAWSRRHVATTPPLGRPLGTGAPA